MPDKILVSACLLGHAVRYDGKGKPLAHPLLQRWSEEGRVVAICPELAAGMSVPRPPAEIENGMTGEDVLSGRARVVEITGADVTAQFIAGAERAVALARESGCRHALLIDGSPSCGSGFIYDGSFAGKKLAGNGVTVALMARAGIAVYSDRQIDVLGKALAQLV